MNKHLLPLIIAVFTACILVSCGGKSAESLLDQFENELNNARQISNEIENLLESRNEEDVEKAAEKQIEKQKLMNKLAELEEELKAVNFTEDQEKRFRDLTFLLWDLEF